MILNDYSNDQNLQSVAVTSFLPSNYLPSDHNPDAHNSSNATQDNLSPLTDDNNDLSNQLDVLAAKMDLDGWSRRILDESREILLERTQFSIEHLIEAIANKDGEIPIKEGTLRKKLKTLVEKGLLQSIAGQGRIPTYYFGAEPQSLTKLLSHDQIEPFDNDSDEVIALKKTLSIYERKRQLLSKEVEEKHSWLQKAEIDIESYDTVIESIKKELGLLVEL
jgi:Fe2+ or Zn2+ uptake regulation protein